MATLSIDTFQRADQAGWGTASDGEAWATVAGSPTLGIASNEGTVLTGALAADAVILLGSQTTAPINYLVRLKIQDGNAGAVWRYQSAGNYYRAVCETGTVYLQKCVGGSFSTIASAGGTFTGFTWLRIVSSTTDIAVTFWADGGTEPGSPQISTSDSAFTTAGQYGLSDVSYGGTLVNFFDHLTVTDNQSTTTSTRTVPADAALSLTSARTVSATAALELTGTRTVPASAALIATETRTVSATAALELTSTRTIGADAALSLTSARTVLATAALSASQHRTVPCTAALSGVAVAPPTNCTFYVRGGQGTFYTRSGEATFYIRDK